MKQVNKKELLYALKKRVEKHLAQIITEFQDKSDKELSRPSATGGWSIVQCLDHLNSYGNYYLPEIKKALAKANKYETHVYKSSWLGAYFIQMMEPKTGGKKYKAFNGHIPALNLNSSLVIEEFIRQQKELLFYLEDAHAKDLDKRLPISITKLIRLKLGDVFQFLIAHNERHMQQAKRNLILKETPSKMV